MLLIFMFVSLVRIAMLFIAVDHGSGSGNMAVYFRIAFIKYTSGSGNIGIETGLDIYIYIARTGNTCNAIIRFHSQLPRKQNLRNQ